MLTVTVHTAGGRTYTFYRENAEAAWHGLAARPGQAWVDLPHQSGAVRIFQDHVTAVEWQRSS